MLVIRSDDRNNYLKVLHQCDLLTGKIPYDGAHATLQQAKPLVDYISAVLENKLTALIQLAKGEISELIEAIDDEKSGQKKVVRKSGQKKWSAVLELIKENPKITRGELSYKLGINPSAIQRHIQNLKKRGCYSTCRRRQRRILENYVRLLFTCSSGSNGAEGGVNAQLSVHRFFHPLLGRKTT